MKISEVVKRKGSHVVTIAPDASVSDLVKSLYDNRIGACVVSLDGVSVAGIVSERDVVVALHERGTGVLEKPVSSIMTPQVHSCVPDDELQTLAVNMTEHRVRHMPVLGEDGSLLAIVSIGDVVKNRLDELEVETSQLIGYVQGDRSV